MQERTAEALGASVEGLANGVIALTQLIIDQQRLNTRMDLLKTGDPQERELLQEFLNTLNDHRSGTDNILDAMRDVLGRR